MTRVTNLGYKRTYLEAGFDDEGGESNHINAGNDIADVEQQHASGSSSTVQAPAKKKKKSKKTKSETLEATSSANIRGEDKQEEEKEAVDPEEKRKKAKNIYKAKLKKRKEEAARKAASTDRRVKPVDQRKANITCLVCRDKGHVAKDCPKANGRAGEENGLMGSDGHAHANGKGKMVGICYRCGSTRHNLSKCKAPVDPSNPLPYASCFVCSGVGHLASACPQNTEKGIYPNGGCCKLCGEKTHLARDCPLRKKESTTNTNTSLFVGTGREAGADEDDFHTFKRTQTDLDREEKKLKRLADEKVKANLGISSGAGRNIGGQMRQNKKVVVF